MGNLNGFASLRTRPNVPLTVEPKEKRRCPKCGAVLAEGRTGLCRPCGGGHVELPSLLVFLAEQDASDYTINTIARRITGEAYLSKAYRDALIRKMGASGEYSHSQIAEAFGISKSAAQAIIWNRYRPGPYQRKQHEQALASSR